MTRGAPSDDVLRTRPRSVRLGELLDSFVRPAELVRREADGAVRCLAFAHRCLVRPGRRGVCQVRFNRDGRLYAPANYVAGLHSDPIEKKPFYHVLPGCDTLTFGMLGCDFHCGYCQNWLTSQAIRDESAGTSPTIVSARELVTLARQSGAPMVTSSYNEPSITAEWAVEVFRHAKAQGLKTAFVSNGNCSREALEYIRPVTDCYKIDLKSMSDPAYRKLGGVLASVLDGIRMVYEMGFWLEIVTLLVPGFNDDPVELGEAARFIASVSPDIPWHVTAFHGEYRMADCRRTRVGALLQACEIGKEAGLRYVYAGNLAGRVGSWEHTDCPDCGDRLIERSGYLVRRNRVTAEGLCPSCSARIPGIWH
ncbi:MAG: AmmeMemoRadiSam system radical SAM enzyme [Gemmatimonadales bacterium]|nr:MAG: AmmeMemoRadiSam system radical SAM enzyme [Gemmatimonadales bacterium]